MKITCESGTKFTLQVENEEDQRFIDYLYLNGNPAYVEKFIPLKKDGDNFWTNSGAIIDLRKDNPKALADKAGREFLGAFRQLARLALSDSASN